MAKKKKEYGNCHECGKPLDEFHLQKGLVRVCSYRCADQHSDKEKQKENSDGNNASGQ